MLLLTAQQLTPPNCSCLPDLAGAGKTIALKRAAWEAATSLEAICLWLLDGGALEDDVVLDLYRFTGERIFVFVDRLALRVDPVARLLARAKQKRVPLTVIGSERLNEWNLYGEPLQQVCQATELPIRNLSVSEIGILLDLLTRHNALGLLEGETRENQTSAFTVRAERQLLVALHEATLGKPFEVIVHDEYLRIVPETARQLYLDICTMHQHTAFPPGPAQFRGSLEFSLRTSRVIFLHRWKRSY